MSTQAYVAVIENLSELIYNTLQTLKNEQYCPRSDADAMDETIAGCAKKVKELRRIREEFENIATGALL